MALVTMHHHLLQKKRSVPSDEQTKAAQGGGVYSAWRKRSDCPQGWGLRICYVRSLCQNAAAGGELA